MMMMGKALCACCCALLLSLATFANGSSLRGLQDFQWAVEPVEGFPQVAFNVDSKDGEVRFKYTYDGILNGRKYLSYQIFQYDCFQASDGAVTVGNVDLATPGELVFLADIKQSIISDSTHYKEINPTTALVSFCARVDYNYVDSNGVSESVNFHETKLSITIDLRAGFSIDEIAVEFRGADEARCEAELDFPVQAYFCDSLNNATDPQPFVQGDAMQVCIKMDDNVVSEDIYVKDIISFVVSQPLGPALPSVPIADREANAFTSKVCGSSGICNVKTQLLSQYFAQANPNDLSVDGTALLAFGTPAQRRLQLDEEFLATRALQSDTCETPCTQPVVTNRQGIADYLEFPLEIVIVGGDGDTVTYNVLQRWKPYDTISWLATEYLSYDSQTMTCDKQQIVAWEDNHYYTSQCVNGWAEVTLYVHDGAFDSLLDDAVVPAYCQPSSDVGKKISVTIEVPCGCYSTPFGAPTEPACLSDGSSSTVTVPDPNCRRRSMLVNFRGKLNDAVGYNTEFYHRHLQGSQQEEDQNLSPFSLTAALESDGSDSKNSQGSKNDPKSTTPSDGDSESDGDNSGAILVVIVIVVIAMGGCCLAFFVVGRRRRNKEEEDNSLSGSNHNTKGIQRPWSNPSRRTIMLENESDDSSC